MSSGQRQNLSQRLEIAGSHTQSWKKVRVFTRRGGTHCKQVPRSILSSLPYALCESWLHAFPKNMLSPRHKLLGLALASWEDILWLTLCYVGSHTSLSQCPFPSLWEWIHTETLGLGSSFGPCIWGPSLPSFPPQYSSFTLLQTSIYCLSSTVLHIGTVIIDSN